MGGKRWAIAVGVAVVVLVLVLLVLRSLRGPLGPPAEAPAAPARASEIAEADPMSGPGRVVVPAAARAFVAGHVYASGKRFAGAVVELREGDRVVAGVRRALRARGSKDVAGRDAA